MTLYRNYTGKGKFKPQPREVNQVTLASELEAQVYEAIIHCIPVNRVICHYSVDVLDQSPEFNSRQWRCDFVVFSPDLSRRIYIEAKGVRTEVFMNLLHCLSIHNRPVIENLVIVTPSPGEKFGRCMKSIDKMGLVRLLSCLETTDWMLKPRH